MGGIGPEESNSLNELNHPTCGNNGADTEFHERASTRSKDYSGPVERITGIGSLDSIEWDLGADEVDEEGDCGVDGFLVYCKGDGRFGDCRKEPGDRLD